MSAPFEPGELVDIHIVGARVSDRHVQDKHLWLDVGGAVFFLPVRMLANATATVSRAATTPDPEHYAVGGAVGPTCGHVAECACGVVVAGFDTHAEAVAALDQHIAQPEPDPGDDPDDEEDEAEAAAILAAERRLADEIACGVHGIPVGEW